MNHPVLVKLYFDQYAGLKGVGDEAIVVTDAQSYAAARQAIEKVKAGEKSAPLTIIVRSRHFFMGFHDLLLLGDLVQIIRIAPRDAIARAFHIQLPGDHYSAIIHFPTILEKMVGQFQAVGETPGRVRTAVGERGASVP